MEKQIDDSRIHEGHRSRMHAKLSAHGQHIFDTYELLEMLLYRVIPYKDTNPISKNLLYAFGDLEGVFSASPEELIKVRGIGERAAEYISTIGGLWDVIGAEIVCDEGVRFSDYEEVGRYFYEQFKGLRQSRVLALFLDSSMRLIDMKPIYDLDYESGGVKAKPFIDEAVKNHASVVITAHNHLFGPAYPTQGDRATNKMLNEAMNMAGIIHAEHYIVSGEYFIGIGSLKSFSVKLSQMPEVSSFLDSRDSHNGRLHRAEESEEKGSPATKRNIRDRDFLVKLLSYSGENDPAGSADRLLARYMTLENIFTASQKELTFTVDERTALYLKLLAFITSRRRTDMFTFGKKHSRTEIAEYLKALYLGESVEKIYMLTFDSKDRVTGCELLASGTVNSSEVLPRRAIEVAISASASAVSLAHNHPFGTTKPSSDDLNLTQVFSSIFTSCEIGFRDHFIVAGQICDIIIL